MTTLFKKLVVLVLVLAIPSFALADAPPKIAKTQVGMSLAEFKKVAKNIKRVNSGEGNVGAYQKAGATIYTFKPKGIDSGLAIFYNGKMVICNYQIKYKSHAEFNAITARIKELLGSDFTVHDKDNQITWDKAQFKAGLTMDNGGKTLSLYVFHTKLFKQMTKNAESKVDVGF